MGTQNQHSSGAWLRYVLLVLVVEKIVQHGVVTLAFIFNWGDIRSTVAVNPDLLMMLGGLAAILFGFAFWGLLKHNAGAIGLLIWLALFDIVGEFAAQGTIGIVLNVSFLVAVILLVLGLLYRQRV